MVKKPKKEERKRGGASVLCPTCHRTSSVLFTRRNAEGVVRRLRQCHGPRAHEFYTCEEPDHGARASA